MGHERVITLTDAEPVGLVAGKRGAWFIEQGFSETGAGGQSLRVGLIDPELAIHQFSSSAVVGAQRLTLTPEGSVAVLNSSTRRAVILDDQGRVTPVAIPATVVPVELAYARDGAMWMSGESSSSQGSWIGRLAGGRWTLFPIDGLPSRLHPFEAHGIAYLNWYGSIIGHADIGKRPTVLRKLKADAMALASPTDNGLWYVDLRTQSLWRTRIVGSPTLMATGSIDLLVSKDSAVWYSDQKNRLVEITPSTGGAHCRDRGAGRYSG